MKASKKGRLIAALVGALVLAGCGGGGGGGGGFGFPIGGGGGGGAGGGGDGNAIPASALESTDAFISYMKTLVATALDNSEPLDLGSATAPVSDSAEAVNF